MEHCVLCALLATKSGDWNWNWKQELRHVLLYLLPPLGQNVSPKSKGRKMPKGQTKFNPDWLTTKDDHGDKMSDYFTAAAEDKFHAVCTACNKTVKVRPNRCCKFT